jgi:VIT1/CCC1 family predicted Fe2+/Mn2+ transporter
MTQLLTIVSTALQAESGSSGGVAPFRAAVRVVLGLLIAVLLAYVAVEQVGYWARRRSGRE